MDLLDKQRERVETETSASYDAARDILAKSAGPWALRDFKAELQTYPNVTERSAIYEINELIAGHRVNLTPDQLMHLPKSV